MKVRRRFLDGWIYYRAWRSAGGISFTINDGRVPGRVSTLPDNEFWSIFETVPPEVLWYEMI